MRATSGRRAGAKESEQWLKWIENHVRPNTKLRELPDEFIGYLGGRSPGRAQVLLHLVVWLMAEEYGSRVYKLAEKQVNGKAEQVKFALIFESLRRRGLISSYPGMDSALTRFVSSSPPSGPIHLPPKGEKPGKLRLVASAEQREWLKRQLRILRSEIASQRGRRHKSD